MNERINKYIESFKEYIKDYDITNDKIKLKYNHTLRVMELQNKYAKILGFTDEDIELATLIGILHDIGRFEQVRIYNSFNDLETIDHADFSVEQLFHKNEILKFTDNESWYPIIEFAVRNHNKKEIPNVDDKRLLAHAKLIRDTDKTDIMISAIGTIIEDDSTISDKVLETFKKHGIIDRRDVKTKSDTTVVQYAFIFDINNDAILKEYKTNFINFHKTIKNRDKFKEIYEEVIKYIDERIDKYDRNRN